jgi:hypothetical protein
MYFSLTNSPATFQTTMNEIFQDVITEGIVSIYLDDILIFTNSLEEHWRITCLVLDRMRKHKLYLWPEKCEFEKVRIEYLGVIISHNKVEMDPVKITGVADWPTPSNKKQVQSFVGFVNFYQRFIPGFSHHARALFDLTMKDVRFIWGLPQEDSFMKLKELVTSAPVLVLPHDDLPFRLEANSSGIGTGAVLSQQHVNDNAWLPVAFLSKTLNLVEQNYKIHDTVRGHPSIPLLPLSLNMSICIPHSPYTYPTTPRPLRPSCDHRRSSSIYRYSTIQPTWSQPRLMPRNYHRPQRSNVT